MTTDLLGEVEVIAQPLPPVDLGSGQTRISVGQWQEEVPAKGDEGHDDRSGNPGASHALASKTLARAQTALGSRSHLLARLAGLVIRLGRVGAKEELHNRASNERRGKVSGQIMMQEQLTAHDEEGEVVSCPGEEEEACRVVQARTGT